MSSQILCTKCGQEFIKGRDDGPLMPIERLHILHTNACFDNRVCYFHIYKKHLGLGVIQMLTFDKNEIEPDAFLFDHAFDREEDAEALIIGINQWLLGGKGSARPGEIMINALKPMSNQQRERVFMELRAEFCINCGKHTPGDMVCHCTNDE